MSQKKYFRRQDLKFESECSVCSGEPKNPNCGVSDDGIWGTCGNSMDGAVKIKSNESGEYGVFILDDKKLEALAPYTSVLSDSADRVQMTKTADPVTSENVVEVIQEEPLAWPDNPAAVKEADPLPDFSPFDIPTNLRNYVLDCAKNLQVPIGYVLIPLVVSFIAIIGNSIRVKPKVNDTWRVCVNLWFLLIGSPSRRKSPAQRAGMMPLRHIEKIEQDKYEYAMHGWKTEALKLNAEKEGVLELIRKISAGGNSKKSINELEEELRLIEDALAMAPRLRTISTNDATIEKLADLEAANPAGILFLRDEIFGLLEKVEANENRGDKSFLIEGFEGQDSYKIHRIGRAAPAIKSHTLTIGGTTQPGPIRSFINNCAGVSKANDGMCQRFSLTFYADSEMPLKYVDKKVDTTDEEAIKKAAEKVNKEVINIILSEDDQFKTISFSSEAQQKFIEIYNELSEQIVRSGDSPDFQAHLGKYPKLIPALALIFDVIENGFKNDSLLPEEISLANLLRAESWSKVLFEHAKWLYGLRDSTLNKSTLALHRKIVSGDVVDSMTIRSIYRKNWSFLKSEKDVITAIEGLMELGWCCCQEIKGSRGAPSIVIRLHPNLRHKHS